MRKSTSDSFEVIMKKAKETQRILYQQTYSQEMTECLINDMMDQAKIDNGVFKLNEECFDLKLVVFKAMSIVTP